MQLIDAELAIAATDLGRFLSCRHLTALDIEVALGRRKKPPFIPDPFLDLLRKRGEDHEANDKKSRNDRGETVLDLSDLSPLEAERRCLDAMKSGQPAIAQGVLRGEGFLGLPDVLMRVAKPSALGPWSYEACDTKLALETRAATILQLCLYSELLERVQGVAPERFHVVTPLREEPHRVAEYAALYRLVRGKLVDAAREDPAALLEANYPEPVELCDVCRWGYQCDKRRRADDHLFARRGHHAAPASGARGEGDPDARRARRASGCRSRSSPREARSTRSNALRTRRASSSRAGAATPRCTSCSSRSRRAAGSHSCRSHRRATSSSTSRATTSRRRAAASTSSG